MSWPSGIVHGAAPLCPSCPITPGGTWREGDDRWEERTLWWYFCSVLRGLLWALAVLGHTSLCRERCLSRRLQIRQHSDRISHLTRCLFPYSSWSAWLLTHKAALERRFIKWTLQTDVCWGAPERMCSCCFGGLLLLLLLFYLPSWVIVQFGYM